MIDCSVIPGDDLWVVERDEEGIAVEVTGYMFIAMSDRYVIATPFINGMCEISETMEYHAQKTAEEYDTDLAVFPNKDCFATKEEAENQYNSEVTENE